MARRRPPLAFPRASLLLAPGLLLLTLVAVACPTTLGSECQVSGNCEFGELCVDGLCVVDERVPVPLPVGEGEGEGEGEATCTTVSVSGGLALSTQPGQAAYSAVVAPTLGGADEDAAGVEFYSETPLTGTIDLAVGDNVNYATCVACVLVREDIGSDGTIGRTYFQRSGIAVLDQDPMAGRLAMTLVGVELVEVAIDPSTFESVPVTGGACLSIPSARLDTGAK